MASILKDYSDSNELRMFRGNFYECQKNGTLTPQVQFEYAVCLIRSRNRPEIKEGITLMEELYKNKLGGELHCYLLYLAAGYAKVGEYRSALVHIKKFLSSQPNNIQGKELKKKIMSQLKDDGMKAAAVGGTAALVIGGLVGLGMALMKK
uniref:Mitochondrial fission 1 protein n=1 Tax=Tetranychus urticae TaxID=32264 RepID=T1K3Z3_TETUR